MSETLSTDINCYKVLRRANTMTVAVNKITAIASHMASHMASRSVEEIDDVLVVYQFNRPEVEWNLSDEQIRSSMSDVFSVSYADDLHESDDFWANIPAIED